MNNIFKKALVSEKSFANVSNDKVTFVVDKRADKETISRICENVFGVTVIDVNTANYKGKVKSSRKGRGQRSDFKKAIITLKKGQKIDLFEIETEKDKKEKQKTKDKAPAEKTKAESADKDTTVKVREKKK